MTRFFGWPDHTSDQDEYHIPSLDLFPFNDNVSNEPMTIGLRAKSWWGEDTHSKYCMMPRQGHPKYDGVMLRRDFPKMTVRAIGYCVLESFSNYADQALWLNSACNEVKIQGYDIAVLGGDLEGPSLKATYVYDGSQSQWDADLNTRIEMWEVIKWLVKHYREMLPDLNYDILTDGTLNLWQGKANRAAMIGWNAWVVELRSKAIKKYFHDIAQVYWPNIRTNNWDGCTYGVSGAPQPQSQLPMPSCKVHEDSSPCAYISDMTFGNPRYQSVEEVFSYLDLIEGRSIPFIQSHYQADKPNAEITHEQVTAIHNGVESRGIDYALEW